MSAKYWLLLFCVGLVSTGCKKNNPPVPQATPRATPKAAARVAPRGPKKVVKRNTVLFLGDSLTAGYGLAASEAYPALIGRFWKKNSYPWKFKNAGVSGDTTAGVLRRLDWVMTPEIHTVFLCIGANDGLRGLSVVEMKKNLDKITKGILKRGAKVVLAGMMVPPNYGPKYAAQFKQTYIDLAKKYKLKRLPFLLQSVAGKPKLNQRDGIHPNAKGHELLRRDVLAFFKSAGVLQK